MNPAPTAAAKAIPAHRPPAGIMIFATSGACGMRHSWFDLLLLLVFGRPGYAMQRRDSPVAPVLIGMILGPRAASAPPRKA